MKLIYTQPGVFTRFPHLHQCIWCGVAARKRKKLRHERYCAEHLMNKEPKKWMLFDRPSDH